MTAIERVLLPAAASNITARRRPNLLGSNTRPLTFTHDFAEAVGAAAPGRAARLFRGQIEA